VKSHEDLLEYLPFRFRALSQLLHLRKLRQVYGSMLYLPSRTSLLLLLTQFLLQVVFASDDVSKLVQVISSGVLCEFARFGRIHLTKTLAAEIPEPLFILFSKF